MKHDHEFDPITPEELAEREREAELARKIRREVMRVQRGDAAADLRADEAEETQAREEQEEQKRKEKKRHLSAFWLLFSGNILVKDGISEYYSYLICIATMFFLSIVVMFSALRLDVKYSRLEHNVQMLREKSIRLQEQRYQRTTHSAIVEQLQNRGIELYDPLAPGEMIEEE
ncbi:MAG: FtsL-like putative cell division protein [Alistipes sp.]